MHSIAADLIVALHFAIVAFIVGGEVLILVGAVAGWRRVRDLKLRIAHLLAMAWVAIQSAMGKECPLTIWERDLRVRAGSEGQTGSFIGRLLHDLLYFEDDITLDMLRPWYIAFGLLVVATWWIVRPGSVVERDR